jgi:thymidine phosphorylase
MDVRAIGMSMVSLKAGRSKAEDPIDYAVGLSNMVQMNDYVEQGQPIALAHVRSDDQLNMLNQQILKTIQLSPKACKTQALIKECYQA